MIAQLDSARNRKLVQAWDTPAVLTFDIDGQSTDAALIKELQHDVIAWRWDETLGADVAVFRGIVDATEDQLDEQSHVVTVTCHDYLAMLGRRLLTGASPTVWTSVDQDTIAANLITAATQPATSGGTAFGAAGWLPLTWGYVAGDGVTSRPPSNTLRTLTLQGNAVVGTEFDNLAKLTGGFDYDLQPFGGNPSSGQQDTVRIFYPSQGVIRTEPPLIFGTSVATVQRQVTSADYGNYWRTLGNNQNSAQNAAQIAGEAWNADAQNVAVGTFMSPDQASDQVDPTLLAGVAAGKLNIYGVLIPTYVLGLVPNFYTWQLFNMGDQLPLIIQSGRLNVNGTIRVLGITYSIGDDGDEDVELIVGRALTTLADLMGNLATDIRELSRR